jgi:hypothetical protein
LRGVQPIFRLTIESDREFLGQEVVNGIGLLRRERFADTPQFMSQVFAGSVIGEIRPQDTRQFFATVGSSGSQHQICRERLTRSGWDQDAPAVEANVELSQKPNLKHGSLHL